MTYHEKEEKKKINLVKIGYEIVLWISLLVFGFSFGYKFAKGTPASLASDSEYKVIAFVESLSAGEKTVIAVKKGNDEKKYYRIGRKCASTLPAKFTLPLQIVTNNEDDEKKLECFWVSLSSKNDKDKEKPDE
jgi:hypothetical protein